MRTATDTLSTFFTEPSGLAEETSPTRLGRLGSFPIFETSLVGVPPVDTKGTEVATGPEETRSLRGSTQLVWISTLVDPVAELHLIVDLNPPAEFVDNKN